MSPRSLEKVLYFASYIVIDPGNTDVTKVEKYALNPTQYRQLMAKPEVERGSFRAGIGAEAVKVLLQELDLDASASS
jgi:DNA-directed RNA polymerase subunit beta'